MTPPRAKSNKFSLSTIAKVAATLSAIVASIAGLLTKSEDISKLFRTVFPKDPYVVEVSHADVVPSYLKYYYDNEGLRKEESLYWFRAKMQNKTRESLTLEVSFDIIPGDCKFVVLTKENPIEISLQGKEPKDETVRPPLQWTNQDFDQPCFLKINWVIENEGRDKTYKKADVAEIRLLPHHTVKWDLVNPAHQPVSREFLFSSLAAWSLSRDGTLLQRKQELEKHTATSSPATWLNACYDNLFKGPSALTIYATAKTYPFSGEKIVQSPGEILRSKQAEPLEAGLLMAAMIRAAPPTQRTRLTLFIFPRAEDIPHPSVLLAWSLPDSHAWEAISLTKAKDLDFKTNLEQSTSLLKQDLSQQPQILEALKQQGVFVGSEANSPMALSLDKAVDKYKIRAFE